MTGLIQKDICLLTTRKSMLAMILGIGVLMAFTMEGSFVVGYISMLFAITTTSTISYDEFDNGYPFLMTLPVSRTIYVQSKYVFTVLSGAIGWALGMVVYIIVSVIQGEAFTAILVLEPVPLIPTFWIILAIMLPLQLKFGSEAMRVVIAVIAGAVCAVVFIVMKLLPVGTQPPAWLMNMSIGTSLICLMVVGVIALGVSYLISVRVMNNKEF